MISTYPALFFFAPAALSAPIVARDVSAVKVASVASVIVEAKNTISSAYGKLNGVAYSSTTATTYLEEITVVKATLTDVASKVHAIRYETVGVNVGATVSVDALACEIEALVELIVKTVGPVVRIAEGTVDGVLAEVLLELKPIVAEIGSILEAVLCDVEVIVPGILDLVGRLLQVAIGTVVDLVWIVSDVLHVVSLAACIHV